MFENDVKEYGIQTAGTGQERPQQFENDVKEYGIQTLFVVSKRPCKFENDVKDLTDTEKNNSMPYKHVYCYSF